LEGRSIKKTAPTTTANNRNRNIFRKDIFLEDFITDNFKFFNPVCGLLKSFLLVDCYAEFR